jgi:hypothetical protein
VTAAALTAVPATEVIQGGKDDHPSFQVVILAFDELRLRNFISHREPRFILGVVCRSS